MIKSAFGITFGFPEVPKPERCFEFHALSGLVSLGTVLVHI